MATSSLPGADAPRAADPVGELRSNVLGSTTMITVEEFAQLAQLSRGQIDRLRPAKAAGVSESTSSGAVAASIGDVRGSGWQRFRDGLSRVPCGSSSKSTSCLARMFATLFGRAWRPLATLETGPQSSPDCELESL